MEKEINEMTTPELLEKLERDSYAELTRMTFNDPNRGKLLGEAETYFKIRNGYDQSEQNRLNNYAKNETEDRKVDVEMKKVKNDRARTRADLFKAAMFFVMGIFGGFAGYAMDTWFQQDKRLQKFQQDCQNVVKPR